MNKKIEQVRKEIAQTKTDLTEKLGQLEGQLREDAALARDSMEQAIQKVQSATKIFSLRTQMRERPLVVIGASVVSGFVIARWLSAPRGPRVVYQSAPGPMPTPTKAAPRTLAERFPKETAMVKSAVVSFLLDFVAKKASENLPHLVGMMIGTEGSLRAKPKKRASEK